MRAIALAIIIGLGGVEAAIRHEQILDKSAGVQSIYGAFVLAFIGCLILGI